MGHRRKAREYALQILYQLDLNPDAVLEEVLEEFWSRKGADPAMREFTNLLVRGTLSHREEVDQQIQIWSEHWRLDRISVVDRNILRMAIFELFYVPDVPVRVTINEAIEIAKRYGERESAAFVNGILDRVARENKHRLEAKWEPLPAPPSSGEAS